MSVILLISDVFLFCAIVSAFISFIGLIRFNDFFSKLHSSSVLDTLSSMLCIIGVMLRFGGILVKIKLFLLLVLMTISSTSIVYSFARSVYLRKNDK